MDAIKIGVIGGSGLYDMETLQDVSSMKLDTPFGSPSDEYIVGTLSGVRVAFLPRHGRGHRFSPSELNFRANIYGFKALGVEHIMSVSAVGSLKEHIHPQNVVIPDQFFDRTRGRVSTFFGDGLVAHVSFADPVCPSLSELLYHAAVEQGATAHKGGTYLCMEGPAFSTRAESHVYRKWDMDIIGMTNLQEAKLAREAEICYATIALVTDYDCWHPDHDHVTVEQVVKVLFGNAEKARALVKAVVPMLGTERGPCPAGCDRALDHALITAPDKRDPDMLAKLDVVARRVLAA